MNLEDRNKVSILCRCYQSDYNTSTVLSIFAPLSNVVKDEYLTTFLTGGKTGSRKSRWLLSPPSLTPEETGVFCSWSEKLEQNKKKRAAWDGGGILCL